MGVIDVLEVVINHIEYHMDKVFKLWMISHLYG